MNASIGRLASAIVAGLAAGALVAGCGDDDEDDRPVATSPPAAAGPVKFAVTATANGAGRKALEFPASIEAGVVEMTLTNKDSVPRSAQIIRLAGGHTVDDVLKIVNSEEQGVKIPAWMQDGGGVGAVGPRASRTATQVLTPGTWAIWDDEGGDEGPGNSELGAKGHFTVTGEVGDAELPDVAGRVTATDEGEGKDKQYGFDFDGLKAGGNQVRFENTGEELHHALFFPIAEGKTIKDVEAAFASDEEPEGAPPVNFDSGLGTSVVDGGIAQNVSLDLPAGRYAVVCFISDRAGGEPHAAKGMLEELTVE